MAELTLIPISTLTQAVQLNAWDVFPIVQDGETKIASIDKLPSGTNSAEIEGSTGALNVVIPAGKLLAFFAVRCSNSGSFGLGRTVGGVEILEAESIDANTWYTYQVSVYGEDGGATIYFSNLPGTARVKAFYMG